MYLKIYIKALETKKKDIIKTFHYRFVVLVSLFIFHSCEKFREPFSLKLLCLLKLLLINEIWRDNALFMIIYYRRRRYLSVIYGV